MVLTPHVLEHVPDTDEALAELFRVIAPGGRMYLQIPIVYGATAAPTEPEFHADNTPVFWNFGWDLTDLVRAAGFTTTVLVTEEYDKVLRGDCPSPTRTATASTSTRCSSTSGRTISRSSPIDAQSRLMGFEPCYHFATWECLRP